jgi:hypothetical protein
MKQNFNYFMALMVAEGKLNLLGESRKSSILKNALNV